jgi:hypothetical protein
VTDADLSQAVAARNAVIANPAAIKGLISKYRNVPASQPFHMSGIPQAQRRDFLAKLAVLPKA